MNSVPAHVAATQGVAPEIVSEHLAEALRNDQIEDFSTASPYAACLLPLLKELGWHNYAR